MVDKVIQRNAFFGHAENILLAMLSDDRTHIRELAYRRIMAARKENGLSSRVREFRVPSLNFEAKDYTELVEWQQIDRYEPPLTMTKYLHASNLRTWHEYVNLPNFLVTRKLQSVVFV